MVHYFIKGIIAYNFFGASFQFVFWNLQRRAFFIDLIDFVFAAIIMLAIDCLSSVMVTTASTYNLSSVFGVWTIAMSVFITICIKNHLCFSKILSRDDCLVVIFKDIFSEHTIILEFLLGDVILAICLLN